MNSGFVYLVEREDGLMKVGFTNNLNQRLPALALEAKQNVNLWSAWHHDRAREIEGIVHTLLSSFRAIRRETYRADKITIVEAILKAICCLSSDGLTENQKYDFKHTAIILWQDIRRERYRDLAVLFGRELTREEKYNWQHIDGGMDDVPFPEEVNEWNWERTMHGLKAARERGKVGGRKEEYHDAVIKAALKKAGSVRGAAKIVGCGEITIKRRQEAGRV